MLAYLFVIFAVAVRLAIPYMQTHPWHFTPVAASLLFFGARGSRRQLWIPVALLALSDIVLSKFVYHYAVDASQLVSWAWYAAIVVLGTRLHNNEKPLWIGGAALLSPISFFLVSNFAAWATMSVYPKNFGGLMTSYALGLPFFKNDLMGTLLFSAVFFAVPVVLRLPQTVRHKTAA
jgi:uncharacterized protein DUF6580